ncbi:MAG: membrane protein insertion efficiency factor YidD [Alphaproteobacteria bacterium]|nr:membrane protein insertion efficiency factor YidD [Alphaproteobacteria bacterium]
METGAPEPQGAPPEPATPSRPGRLDRLARFAAALPIHAYRYLLSPLLGPRCRFAPTCSAYAIEAIGRHGAAKGLVLAARRLARCHPLTFLGGSSGFDPVPRHARWRDLFARARNGLSCGEAHDTRTPG